MATATICIVALLAWHSPAVLAPHAAIAKATAIRAWAYFWSMMFGAAPFLWAGGVIARGVAALPRAWSVLAMILAATCMPVCDCVVASYCPLTARSRPWLAGLILPWASCCNPLALTATAVMLGPHVLAWRMGCGALASGLTALAWHACGEDTSGRGASEQRIPSVGAENTARAVVWFACAAGVSALWLAFAHGKVWAGPWAAASFGALMSPCSSADALMGRVLFAQSRDQVCFLVASQCMDLRQLCMLRANFGAKRAALALCAALVACMAAARFA